MKNDVQTLDYTPENFAFLQQQVASLTKRLQLFERQLFGRKSEKMIEPCPRQNTLALGEGFDTPVLPPLPEAKIVPAHTRRKKQRSTALVTEQGLRFGPDVQVQVIDVKPDELKHNPDAYHTSIRHHYKLAQTPATYRVIDVRYHTIIDKASNEITAPTALPAVLERSPVDVSFLAMMLMDKFMYHLPLYRQHQRLTQGGIQLSRSTLTHWANALGQLLAPIAEALRQSILSSKRIIIDETPMKVAKHEHKPQMKQAYIWPMIGDHDEIMFHDAPSRSLDTLKQLLGDFSGTLLSDGYTCYDRYCKSAQHRTHAQFRVEEGVTALNPHRPGRAQLTHPVPHNDCFAA